MVNYRLKFKKSDIILFLLVSSIILIVLVKSIPYFSVLKNERGYFQEIFDPDEIIVILNDKEIALDKETSIRFLKELQSDPIGYQNTSEITKIHVKLIIHKKGQDIDRFYISPDSYYSEKYWVFSTRREVSEIKRIQSSWLKDFFKENGFFDHEKILPH